MALAIDICLAAVVFIAGVIWLIRNSGDPNKPKRGWGEVVKPPAKTRHGVLMEARARIERQIEILQVPAGGPSYRNAPPDVSAEIAELQELLDGINRELALNQ